MAETLVEHPAHPPFHRCQILELLRKNPAGTIPVVLKRLKQKDVEWRKARQVRERGEGERGVREREDVVWRPAM